MSQITADEVLELRKKYKRAKAQYRVSRTPQPEAAAKAEPKPPRKKRAPRERTAKEKANDARLKAQVELAKKIRAENPSMPWTEAVKKAAAQLKQ